MKGRVSLKANTKVRDGRFFSLSKTRATNFADKAHKMHYDVYLQPSFGRAGWEISVSDWGRKKVKR